MEVVRPITPIPMTRMGGLEAVVVMAGGDAEMAMRMR